MSDQKVKIIQSGTPIQMKLQVSRDAAILAGRSRYGAFVVEMDPGLLSREHRELLARRPVTFLSDNTRVLNLECDSVAVGDASLESVQTILDHLLVKEAAEAADIAVRKQARTEELLGQMDKFLSLDDEKCLTTAMSFHDTYRLLSYWTRVDSSVTPFMFSGYLVEWQDLPEAAAVEEKLARLEAEVSRRNEIRAAEIVEEEAKKAEAAAAEQAEQEARKEAQAAQIEAWVMDRGTANQRARMEAGVLPHDEIKDAIRNEVFAVLDQEFTRYAKIQASDVCDCYDTCKVSFQVKDAKTMTSEQWDSVEAVKRLVPTATVKLRVHEARGEDCERAMVRYSMLVTQESGVFRFSREYSAPGAEE